MGDCGASRPSVVSEDDESVEFSKMDQPSTTGPSSSSESTTCVKIVTPSSRRSHGADFHAVTTVRGEEMCWRESWGRCIVFQRGRRLRPGGKKVPRAFWTPSFVGLAMAEVP